MSWKRALSQCLRPPLALAAQASWNSSAMALAASEVVTLCHQGTPLLSGRLYLD
jgi:hypothetical protein